MLINVDRRAKKTPQSTDAVVPPMSPTSRRILKAQQQLAQDAAFDELLLIRASNGGKKTHGDIKKIVDKYKERGHFVERCHLEYRMELRAKGLSLSYTQPLLSDIATVGETIISDLSTSVTSIETPVDGINNVTTVAVVTFEEEEVENNLNGETYEKRKGGRKKGMTNKRKKNLLAALQKALTEASSLCSSVKKESNSRNVKLPNGTFQKIINTTEEKFGLEKGCINFETVKSRVFSNNLTGVCHQKVSPLVEVEELIVDCCIRLSKMGEALTKFEMMDLANDIIVDTIHADRLVTFCKSRNIAKDVSKGKIVGARWYSNFMKRHGDKLKSKPCRMQDRNRLTWCTVENFENMYTAVYEAMVEAGVATKYDEEVMLDRNGNITNDVEKLFGRKTKYQLIKPHRCVYVDETGCNTNMKEDGHIGGRRYIMAEGQVEGARTGVTSDLHFTVLPFMSGTGAAIMCAVVLKSDKSVEDLPISWKLGIDVSRNVRTGETLVETYDIAYADGVSIGGPKCTFEGVELPCFVCCSPSASITSELLAEMLATIDNAGIFSREEGEGVPFLLIDGHHSRTRLPFLNYINNPAHLWKVCIGVPYATHMWQPHDSSELNGSFKTKLYKTKETYLHEKPPSLKKFSPTDIIPILNKIWPATLGNSEFGKKALLERGWSVLNYSLLDDPRLIGYSHIDETTTEVGEDNGFGLDTQTINNTRVGFSNALDKMIDDRLKSEGRKRKYDEIRSATVTKEQQIQHLEKMLSVSSGKLASNNIFCLDNNVREKMVQNEEEKKKKDGEVQKRKSVQQLKQRLTFRQAAKKYFNKQTLNATEIRSLLKHIYVKNDAPPAKRITELREQLHSRRERLEMYNFCDDASSSLESTINNRSHCPPSANTGIIADAISVNVEPVNVDDMNTSVQLLDVIDDQPNVNSNDDIDRADEEDMNIIDYNVEGMLDDDYENETNGTNSTYNVHNNNNIMVDIDDDNNGASSTSNTDNTLRY
jgi:hypothetical protein